jgi:hypothetical protein
MTYAELSEAQARRSRQFAEAQTDAMSVYCDAERDLKDLQAENDSLRELVRDMMRYYAMPNCIDYKREAALLERAHNLGIEVDE